MFSLALCICVLPRPPPLRPVSALTLARHCVLPRRVLLVFCMQVHRYASRATFHFMSALATLRYRSPSTVLTLHLLPLPIVICSPSLLPFARTLASHPPWFERNFSLAEDVNGKHLESSPAHTQRQSMPEKTTSAAMCACVRGIFICDYMQPIHLNSVENVIQALPGYRNYMQPEFMED